MKTLHKVALFLAGVAILLTYLNSSSQTTRNFKSRLLRATTTQQCILPADMITITNAQNTVNSLISAVNALNPQPVPETLTAFNTAVSNINAQIATLIALPVCCSGAGQEYNSSTNSCRCKNPYGLDTNGNCSVSCTFTNATWTGSTCGCSAGNINSTGTLCTTASDTTTNGYISQLSTLLNTISSLPKSIALPTPLASNITDSSWTMLTGGVGQVDFDGNVLVGVNTYTTAYYAIYTPPNTFSAWGGFTGSYTWITINTGRIFAVNGNGQVFYKPSYGSGSWSNVSNTPAIMKIELEGNVLVGLDSSNNAYYADTNITSSPNWTKIASPTGATLSRLSVSNQRLFACDTSGNTYYSPVYSSGVWVKNSNGSLTGITHVKMDGQSAVAVASGAVWLATYGLESTPNWVKIAGTGFGATYATIKNRRPFMCIGQAVWTASCC
jgi:hypothetical protein